ncbi:MAG: pilus assembly protein [Pirellulaceae bacterium]
MMIKNTSCKKQPVRRRHRFNRSGTTSVEFAFVAPVLFLIIFASIEISRMVLLRNMAQDAAYDAARYAMVEGSTTQEAIDRAQETLDMFSAINAQVTINNGDGLEDDDEFINVEVTIPMQDNSFFMSQFYSGRYIVESVALRTERYKGFYEGN